MAHTQVQARCILVEHRERSFVWDAINLAVSIYKALAAREVGQRKRPVAPSNRGKGTR